MASFMVCRSLVGCRVHDFILRGNSIEDDLFDDPRRESGCGYRWQQRATMKDEASYVCDSCGEEIVVLIDLSAGDEQEYVEDCLVCCCPNVVHVEVDEGGKVRV